MDLLDSNIKTSLQSETASQRQQSSSPPDIDCCISKVNQALETVEKLLFINFEAEQKTYITMEDKVKLLSARVESLEQQLLLKESELQAIQAQNSTNQNFVAASKPDTLTLVGAIKLAKNILASKSSIYESVAKLLSGIYNTNIEAEELAPLTQFARRALNKCNNTQNSLDTQLHKLRFMYKALKEESTALRNESMSVRNRVAELKAKSKNIIARTASLKKK